MREWSQNSENMDPEISIRTQNAKKVHIKDQVLKIRTLLETVRLWALKHDQIMFYTINTLYHDQNWRFNPLKETFPETVCFDKRRYLANMDDLMWNVNAWHATIYLNPNQTKITDMYHSGLWYLVDEGPMMAPQRSPSPGTPSSLSSSSDSETSGGTYLKRTKQMPIPVLINQEVFVRLPRVLQLAHSCADKAGVLLKAANHPR